MEKLNELEQLALEAGIQPGYTDHRGIFQQIASETRQALLQAMGLLEPGGDPAAVLAERRSQSWQALLPTVLVQREEDLQHEIPLVLEHEETEREIHYYLAADQGESFSGRIAAADLEPGERRETSSGGQRRFLFVVQQKLVAGYHRLTLHTAKREATLRLIIAPASCYLPERLRQGHRFWGPALHLTSLRSERNWGIGDFGDLARFIDIAAGIGADAVGLAPLQIQWRPESDRPGCRSSSRYFADPLFLDLTRVTDYSAERFQEPHLISLLAECRQAERIDRQQVERLKNEGFRILFRDFRKYHLDIGSERASEFRMFVAAGGRRLRLHVLFAALQAHFISRDPDLWSWRRWPREFRHPDSEEVLRFAHDQREEVDFHSYILWQTELQLDGCGKRCLEHHLGLGLCTEIGAGVDPDGAETWAGQPLYSLDATVGSPPDEQHPEGFDRGLAPPIPARLMESAYEPFIALLRSSMHHAGAVQLDQAGQMLRLFWIPAGGSPRDGAFVQYPLEDLLGIIALESRRNRCMVIGCEQTEETDYFARELREKHIFPCGFLLPAKDDSGAVRPPADYPEQTAAMVSASGMPSLSGYWEGFDLEPRRRKFETDAREKFEEVLASRQAGKKKIIEVLEEEELLPPDISGESGGIPDMTDALNRAIHRCLARSPALLVLVRLEDIFRVREKMAPYPADQREEPLYPRLSPDLEEMAGSSVLADSAAAVGSERRSRPPPHEPRGHQPTRAVIPRATYRLQLNRDFTFADAAAIVPYLAELGISHCYTSPCFAARSGSTHGYDVVNPNDFNQELGGMEGYRRFSQALQEKGMGQIMDIVPNHMGVMGSDNSWWLDVLENGRSSSYAPFFDIDWEPVKEELRHKLLVPVLGEPYGLALEQGHLVLKADIAGGLFSVCYYNHRFPLDPRTYPLILNRRLDMLEIRMGQDNPFLIELHSLITAFGQLSPPAETDTKKIRIRRRDKEIHKERLALLAEKCPDIGRHLQETADEFNSRTADGSNLQAFHALLERQPFRLAYWRVAADEINYRRFFDINDLAALCVEKEEVFELTHRLIFDLVRQGKVDGLRVDHPDGLYAPEMYYRQLTAKLRPDKAESAELPVYLVAEKILAHHEHLVSEWPVHGTTGYDFASLVNGLFIDSRSEKHLSRTYRRFTAIADDFDTILYHSKKRIMQLALASELNVLANRLDKLSERDWRTRDFTLNSLRDALAEIAACFPVYRTYVTEESTTVQDRNFIEWAVAQAKQHSPVSDQTIFDFLRSILLLDLEGATDREFRLAAADIAKRFQQLTAPVMAKGMEDTAFYIYNRLLSLNEVGGDPRRFGVSVNAFHRLCRERAERWPHTMLATSTHDSKRSEDARCRLNVLSEIPERWQEQVNGWARLNQGHTRKIEAVRAPSANDEYSFYQTLLAIWPLGKIDDEALSSLRGRLGAYMEKAGREAKTHTSWAEPNLHYEEAVASFVKTLLTEDDNLFLSDFLPFQRMVARLGLYNSLSQCLLKLSVPGIPDTYQGCELWNFRLVDPDNRQPVDYARGQAVLTELKRRRHKAQDDCRDLAAELLANLEDGRLKLFLTWRLLDFRRENEDLFRQGSYIPLAAAGPRANHVCAFARRFGKEFVVAAGARLFGTLTRKAEVLPCGPVWQDTFLEAPAEGNGCWRDILTGVCLHTHRHGASETFALEQLFATLPVAFLEYEDGD